MRSEPTRKSEAEELTIFGKDRVKTCCTFLVSDVGGRWQVYRDTVFSGDFLSHGDAVRAACFGARKEEQRGRTSRVLAPPADQLISHYEPHFGL